MSHVGTRTQNPIEVKVRWATYINPTEGYDVANGTCVFGDYIAVVGEVGRVDFSTVAGRPYVALLRKSDGGVVKEWIGSEWGGLSNCISINGKLYVIGYTYAGYRFIYVFDRDLNILVRIRGGGLPNYLSPAHDGRMLYIGGWTREDVNKDGIEERVWLVEKRDPNDLSLIALRKIYLDSWRSGEIHDIGVEPSTGRVWVIGFYIDSSGKLHSLIVMLDSDLRDVKVVDYPPGSRGYLGKLYSIAFDGRQYVYVSGGYGVAKFSVDGELIAVYRDIKVRYKIVYNHGYLYTFRRDYDKGRWRHILCIHDTNLNFVKKYVLSENTYLYLSTDTPILEGNNVYIVETEKALGHPNSRILVYSLALESVPAVGISMPELLQGSLQPPESGVLGTGIEEVEESLGLEVKPGLESLEHAALKVFAVWLFKALYSSNFSTLPPWWSLECKIEGYGIADACLRQLEEPIVIIEVVTDPKREIEKLKKVQHFKEKPKTIVLVANEEARKKIEKALRDLDPEISRRVVFWDKDRMLAQLCRILGCQHGNYVKKLESTIHHNSKHLQPLDDQRLNPSL